MLHTYEIRSQGETTITKRPQVTSYDSCHEHSVEHWMEIRLLVEESAEEIVEICAPQMAKGAVA